MTIEYDNHIIFDHCIAASPYRLKLASANADRKIESILNLGALVNSTNVESICFC